MIYELKQGIDIIAFLKDVDKCAGEVFFESQEGDRLCLKSQLSKYLFLTVTPDSAYLLNSKIRFNECDMKYLKKYMIIPE